MYVFYMYYHNCDHMFVFALTIHMISTTHNCFYLHSIVYITICYIVIPHIIKIMCICFYHSVV